MQTIVGLFAVREDAERAVQRLLAAGFSNESLGIAVRDSTGTVNGLSAAGVEDMSEEGATAGAVSGAGVGALIGLALVGTTLVMPGIGTFLIGGPLAAAIAGAGIGAASGGILGALIGLGIPEAEAEHYAAGLERGDTLVTVHTTDDRAREARRILDEEGARRTANA